MQLKVFIQALAVVWLVLFAASFAALQLTESEGPQGALARIAAFLTWQLIAFVVATLAAFTTRYAAARGVARIKIIGYVPLALSVFLVASFVALLGFRFFVAPLFE